MTVVNNVLLNWKIFVLVFSFIAIISITNSKIQILPVSGVNFIICSIAVWFLSMWITLIGLHKLLQQDKPIELDLHNSGKQKPLDKPRNQLTPNKDCIKVLAQDIDKYFITKWYSTISNNGDFTAESKVVLEEIINKLLEVQLAINNKVLLHGSLNLYLKNLKEFRRTLKRKEKYGAGIEDLYRYSHTCSNSNKSKEYFIHQMTINLLSHFLNWELWNSLPCHVLVSIVARKLTTYILTLISSPELINYFLLKIIATEEIREKFNLDKFNRISLTQFFDVVDNPRKSVTLGISIKPETTPKSEEIDGVNKPNEGVTPVEAFGSKIVKEVKNVESTEIFHKEVVAFLEIKPEVKVNKKKKELLEKLHKTPLVEEIRPLSKPVKIHEPKSTSSKTWNETHDLSCISFGQDPLDIFQSTPETGKIAAKNNFWDSSSAKSEESTEGSPTNAANILLNEVKNITSSMEGFKSSMKPISDATVHTLHNIKDLQETTVNNALNKIGDFQDEAAGVVEGILDFGRAGFRKGLRLTGLQENIENAKASIISNKQHQQKKKPAKLTRSESQEKTSSGESVESVWINPMQLESPNFDGQILLENSKKIESEKSAKSEAETPLIPFISMEVPEDNESPDPEYEEAADLASTIAKLRSLLQQKSSESSLSTPALSPMPPDDFAQKVLMDSVADLDGVDGVMPTFYKFCAKTATGVFQNTLNTIKTALPGNLPGSDQFNNTERWIFVQTEQSETDLLNRVKKLVHERKDFCTVDTAYEAIDSLDSLQQSTDTLFVNQLQFEDELDDFEVKLPITKALIDILCELLADTDTPFLQEPMVKAVMLSFGITIEKTIVCEANNLTDNLCTNLFTIPESDKTEVLQLDLDVFVEAVLNCFPDYVRHVFGSETLKKALTLFVSSLQIQKINQDVLLQIFELLSMQLINESSQMSPPASA